MWTPQMLRPQAQCHRGCSCQVSHISKRGFYSAGWHMCRLCCDRVRFTCQWEKGGADLMEKIITDPLRLKKLLYTNNVCQNPERPESLGCRRDCFTTNIRLWRSGQMFYHPCGQCGPNMSSSHAPSCYSHESFRKRFLFQDCSFIFSCTRNMKNRTDTSTSACLNSLFYMSSFKQIQQIHSFQSAHLDCLCRLSMRSRCVKTTWSWVSTCTRIWRDETLTSTADPGWGVKTTRCFLKRHNAWNTKTIVFTPRSSWPWRQWSRFIEAGPLRVSAVSSSRLHLCPNSGLIMKIPGCVWKLEWCFFYAQMLSGFSPFEMCCVVNLLTQNVRGISLSLQYSITIKHRRLMRSNRGREFESITPFSLSLVVEIHPDGQSQQTVHHHPAGPAGSQWDHPHHWPANQKHPFRQASERRAGEGSFIQNSSTFHPNEHDLQAEMTLTHGTCSRTRARVLLLPWFPFWTCSSWSEHWKHISLAAGCKLWLVVVSFVFILIFLNVVSICSCDTFLSLLLYLFLGCTSP